MPHPAAIEILGKYFPVLDHGFVALVDVMGDDEAIEAAARLSFGPDPKRTKGDTRSLLRYLRRHKHTTPTEMVELKFHCAMPMFVARQWIRHRTASVNEVSARYSELPATFYTPPPDAVRAQSKTNKQGSGPEPIDEHGYAHALDAWGHGRDHAASTYRALLDAGVARETARIDLPLSTYTQWYWKIDLHNLFNFLRLRVAPDAQGEIQAYARAMAAMAARVAPLAFDAWREYELDGASFGSRELTALRLACDMGGGAVALETAIRAAVLAPREATEFRLKLLKPPSPKFKLDLASAMTPAEAQARLNGTLNPEGLQWKRNRLSST